jgi:hypothetical protein
MPTHLQVKPKKDGFEYAATFETNRDATVVYPNFHREPGSTVNIIARVYYDLGGANHFSGGQDPRGIRVSFSPVVREGQFSSHTLGGDARQSGLRHFILPLRRKSDTKLTQVAELIDTALPTIAASWLDDTPAAIELLRAAVRDVQAQLGFVLTPPLVAPQLPL